MSHSFHDGVDYYCALLGTRRATDGAVPAHLMHGRHPGEKAAPRSRERRFAAIIAEFRTRPAQLVLNRIGISIESETEMGS